MQSLSDSFLIRGSALLADYFKDFFDHSEDKQAEVKLLPKEPFFNDSYLSIKPLLAVKPFSYN